MERPYGREEIIVSKTDTKGVIRYANDVFLRVAGYDESDIVGKPHNVIRHPDMPRAVFQVMWDTIGAGDELFAYVLNLAADGGHYWVLAHVTPTFGPTGAIVGYHSNRRWVEPEIREEVAAVYARIRKVETAHQRTPDAIAAGVEALTDELTAAGHTLDTWVWALAGREMAGPR
ncbi:PAS domain-containing protein [Cellulomonas sp. P22]|uniref:PAS domain-containing protein n=1 Tax=Cellulomonas sp. P22 TaxID=3373189 RepID=UPI0037BDB310